MLWPKSRLFLSPLSLKQRRRDDRCDATNRWTCLRRPWCLTALWVLTLLTEPALAHHSYAMFDIKRTVTISGTVKELRWTNPHVSIELEVPAGANVRHYLIEASPVATLKAAGFKRTSIKEGDKVTIVIYPLRDGRDGGFLYQLKLPDGQVLTAGTGEEKSPANVSTR
jgi:hypothetical protein